MTYHSNHSFLPLTSGLQPQRTLNTPPSACGRKLGTISSRPLKLSPRRTCRPDQYEAHSWSGRAFIGRGEPR